MTNLRWLTWAVTRHFRSQGLQVQIRSIRLGNVAIDGEVLADDWKMAIELKTPRDDITRGIGQLAESLAYGYDKAAMITTLRTARHIDSKVFQKFGLILLGVDSRGCVRAVLPASEQVERLSPQYFLPTKGESAENGLKLIQRCDFRIETSTALWSFNSSSWPFDSVYFKPRTAIVF